MPAAAATTVRALIVEDDPDASDALAAVLRRNGYDVDQAATMGEALVLLERGVLPHVVILDLKLPDANGALLLRRVRRENLPVRVAVATAYPDAAAHPALQRFPPDRVFTKPLDYDELLDWMAKLD
jgi:DNA-binding response OmpR family regulator